MHAPSDGAHARDAGAGLGAPGVVLGEVRTCLLQNEASLPTAATVALMRLTPGASVSRVERPVRRVVSAEQVAGVDCGLRSSGRGGGRGRAVGTVLSHAVTTGGRILQGAAHVTLTVAAAAERREWRHYLQQPGTAEVIGPIRPTDVLDGFLTELAPVEHLDLGSIGGRVVDQVQGSPLLDHRTPLRTRTGVVRWAAELDPDHDREPVLDIVKGHEPDLHLIRFRGRPSDLPTLGRFCEEFALHEWLLSTMQNSIVQRVERDVARGAPLQLDTLAFALNELVPLWMPPTYRNEQMKALWSAMENRTNYTRLFEKLTYRVRDLRDQLGLRARRN